MCLNPITIKVDKSVYNDKFRCVQVPCGKCVICRAKYQNSWTIRIVEEMKARKKTCFFTLTYRPDTLPHVLNESTGEIRQTCLKKHIQDWLKRFRTRYKRKNGKNADFKYFICSELGPRTLRPHYHGLIFGLSVEEFWSALIEWREMYGFVSARNVNPVDLQGLFTTARYVGKYCSKGIFESPILSDEEFPLPPMFRLISKGLGISYVDKNKDYHLSFTDKADRIGDIVNKRKYLLNDTAYSLPRYYQDKIYGSQSLLRAKIANYILALNDDIHNAKFKELCATMSPSEAINTIVREDAQLLTSRAEETTRRYSSFLNKSKL